MRFGPKKEIPVPRMPELSVMCGFTSRKIIKRYSHAVLAPPKNKDPRFEPKTIRPAST
jgi:hypothetical protein